MQNYAALIRHHLAGKQNRRISGRPSFIGKHKLLIQKSIEGNTRERSTLKDEEEEAVDSL